MARLRSCAAEHDIAGVGPVDGNPEAIGVNFKKTCDRRNYIISVGLPGRPNSSRLVCPLFKINIR
jgi:hypothetical protein